MAQSFFVAQMKRNQIVMTIELRGFIDYTVVHTESAARLAYTAWFGNVEKRRFQEW